MLLRDSDFNSLANPLDVEPFAVDRDVGIFCVEGVPLVEQVFEALPRLECNASRGHVREAFFQRGQAGLEEDDFSEPVEVGHPFGSVANASAGGDHMVLHVEAENRFLFDLAKRVEAFRVHNLLKGTLLSRLDDQVGIDKLTVDPLRQDDTDGAFSGAWHADKCDVRSNFRSHGRSNWGSELRKIVLLSHGIWSDLPRAFVGERVRLAAEIADFPNLRPDRPNGIGRKAKPKVELFDSDSCESFFCVPEAWFYMTKKTEIENKVAVKMALAAKYRHLATLTHSVPAKAKFLRRSECFQRQAGVIGKALAV